MEQEFIIPKEKIDKMNKSVAKFKIFLLSACVLFVVCIPMIVVSATNHILAGIIVFAILAGLLFYTIPIGFGWLWYINRRKQFFMVLVNNQFTKVEDIVSATGKSRRSVLRNLRGLMKRGYLVGWKFNQQNTELVLTQTLMMKCPHCNAPVRPLEKICSYCNGTIRK